MDDAAPLLDAAALVSLLATPERRRVFAALVLGASTVHEIESASALPTAPCATALGRLVAAGLVEQVEGRFHLLGEAFPVAARAARHQAPAEVALPEGVVASKEAAKVFAAFVREGRITQIPSAAGKRRVLLEWLSQSFEPGRRYSEQMVNLILGTRHADTAAWRRYLVDEDFLSREDGVYWRSGGAVPT
jgi:hypothetical protein